MADVVSLKQPRKGPPELVDCVFRLDPETFSLEATLTDTDGNIAILTFGLESKPLDFDLSLLTSAWARWRRESDAIAG